MSKSNQNWRHFFFVYEYKSRLLLIVYYMYILNIWYTIFNSIRKIICDLDYTQMCYTSIPRWNNKVEQLHIMLSALEYWIESFQFILYATGWIAQIIFSKKDITLFW